MARTRPDAVELKASGSNRNADIELASISQSPPIRDRMGPRSQLSHIRPESSGEGAAAKVSAGEGAAAKVSAGEGAAAKVSAGEGAAAKVSAGARVVELKAAIPRVVTAQGGAAIRQQEYSKIASNGSNSKEIELHRAIPKLSDKSMKSIEKQQLQATRSVPDSQSQPLNSIAGKSRALNPNASYGSRMRRPDPSASSVNLRQKELIEQLDDDLVLSTFQEQKNWISSVLTAASAAGEENIQFRFTEDKHLSEGCASCGPDASSEIWRADRPALWIQSCCWRFYNSSVFKWMFRGDNLQYPNIEPAQKFRCGWKMLQERLCVLIFLFLALTAFAVAAFPVFLRLNTQFQIANVDYNRISHFRISCNGCKIQISNNNEWASYFAPCNLNLFFPSDGSYDTDSFISNECQIGRAPTFCDYSAGTCNLEIRHRASVSFSAIKHLLSMEVIDNLVYPWPTVDAIIPSWWNGTLELINPGSASDQSASIESPEAIPLIVLPFNSKSFTLSLLNTMIDKRLERAKLIREVVSLPNLIIRANDALSPVHFLANRGGSLKNVSMNCITGSFSARDITFASQSKVSISIPQGDVTFNTQNHIATSLVSLYSATAPVVLNILPIPQPAAGVTSFVVSLVGLNFRNVNSGDIFLSFQGVASAARIPDCVLQNPTSFIDTVGSVDPLGLLFSCKTKFTESSDDLKPLLYSLILNYFGGTILLPYSFQLNVLVNNGVVSISNLMILPTNTSTLARPSANPNQLCAVGGNVASDSNTLISSGFVPKATPVAFMDQPILISTPDSSVSPVVSFSCRAARSLSVGSHPYSYGNQPDPVTQLGRFPTMHQPSSTFSYQDERANNKYLPDLSPEVKISHQDQRQIAFFAQKVLNGSLDYLIINVLGSGANLPGFFIFTLKSIYTVMDPAIIQTLTFGLLPISRTAINVYLSPGLCPDYSEITVNHANPTSSEGEYASIRISQVYSVLESAIRSAISDGGLTRTLDLPSFAISFRFRLAAQVWAAVFQIVERVSTAVGTTLTYYSLLYDGSLKINPSASSLITLSILLPIMVALFLGFVAAVALSSRVEELRSNFFLSSIEGSRLSSIEVFRGLSSNAFALKSHVSKLVGQAPPAANLQSRHTVKLLKFFELFEISSKVPQDGSKHQEWYIKIVRGRFALLDIIKNSLKQFFSDVLDAVPGYDLLNSNQKSFMNIFFKKVNTKYSRRLMFSSYILNLLECNPKGDLLRLLHVDQSKRSLNHISCQVKVIECLDPTPTSSDDEEEYEYSCNCYTQCRSICDDSSILMCVPKSKDEHKNAAIQRCLHVGVGVRFTRKRRGKSAAPFPPDGDRKFIISEVLESDDPSIAHIVLECVNPASLVDFKSFEKELHQKDAEKDVGKKSVLMMHFDDPLVVDDDTIEWFKSNDMFRTKELKLLIGRVICDDNHDLVLLKSKDTQPKDTVWRKNDFVLKYNPFEHRTLIVLATIFYDACEAYRSVVSATGVEFFMDLILVNGAANMKKWKKFGSISQVQNFREDLLSKAPTPPANSMNSTEQHDGGSSDAQQRAKLLSSSNEQPPAAESSKSADAEDAEASNISAMPVVNIEIPRSTQRSSTSQTETRHVVLNLSNDQNDVKQMLQSQEGQAGSFFSIHSTIQEPITCSLGVSPKGGVSRCCLCCAYKSATFEEQWSPYQPGQVFFARADNSANHPNRILGEQNYLNGKLANPYTVVQPMVPVGDHYDKYKCCVARVEFDDFMKYIESLDTSDDGSKTATAMFASEMLSYYRPKGRMALISPFLHVTLIVSACIPTLALFTLWGLNQYAFYCYTITQTTAFGFLFVCFYFIGAGFIYLLIVYLDFPYMFFGRKCCGRMGFGHFFFTPVTGVLFPILRRVFYGAFGLILVVDLACIFLSLMWIALGVVVNPALAIPYATGIVVFITNLNSVRNSLTNSQQMIVDEVLGLLIPFIKSQIVLPDFANSLKQVANDAILALNTDASDSKPLRESLEKLKMALQENTFEESIVLRKLKEGEVSMLLRSLWSSIREELGLSERNIVIAVLASSLILGFLLIFIFIGVSVFADSSDPFASVVNSLLTVGAGLGVNSNVDKGTTPDGERNMMFKLVVEKFCLLLQTRLKNSCAIFVKILALASCAESDAAIILHCIMQASDKFKEPAIGEEGGIEQENHADDGEVYDDDENYQEEEVEEDVEIGVEEGDA